MGLSMITECYEILRLRASATQIVCGQMEAIAADCCPKLLANPSFWEPGHGLIVRYPSLRPKEALTSAAISARTASGRYGHAATTVARSGSLLQLSMGN